MIRTLKLWESMMGSHCLWELPGSYDFQHKGLGFRGLELRM